MVQINFARKEVNCKIVYYGPGLSGKTTNLEIVHQKAPSNRKGELTSIATEGDRTLFFDFMPLDLGKVGGMNTKFQLYTVPGQVYYNATRKLVLQGADGVIFVADSQKDQLEQNKESLENLKDNLAEQGIDIATIPLVIQYNKRDLPDIMDIETMQKEVNIYGAPYYEAVATEGQGVFPTLKKLSGLVLDTLNKRYGVGRTKKPAAKKAPPAKKKPPAKPVPEEKKAPEEVKAKPPTEKAPAEKPAPVPEKPVPVPEKEKVAVSSREKETVAARKKEPEKETGKAPIPKPGPTLLLKKEKEKSYTGAIIVTMIIIVFILLAGYGLYRLGLLDPLINLF
jgi:signal recognition particle receptor subunit beta